MNCFSIDFEDWYQGMMLPLESWSKFERRLHIGHERLLTLLARRNVKATYFLLGKTIEEYPELIREIIAEGHEIACHSHLHRPVYELNPTEFESDLAYCKQLIAPFGVSYSGFRAPYFSIDRRCLWALDLLKDAGFTYDSSIFPGNTFRTGIPGFDKHPHRLDNGLAEAPISVFKMMRFSPGTGGAYFRILPYSYFRRQLREIEKRGGYINFYIHPWELDPEHPVITGLSRRVRLPHYFNLGQTESRIRQLLEDFEFGTVKSSLVLQGVAG